MLGTAALRYCHNFAECLQRIYLAERREHFSQFKGDEAVAFLTQRRLGRNNLRFRQICQAVGLDDYRRPAVFGYVFHLLTVGIGVPL